MMDLNKLNPYQKEAVLDESPACLVNANVGSGKTTVLTAKVRYLCEQKGVAPKDLMVLTFTNKAANEIRERLENLTEKRGRSVVWHVSQCGTSDVTDDSSGRGTWIHERISGMHPRRRNADGTAADHGTESSD